jgi:uncharacterized repeat protein (TIGR03803 family)
VHPFRFFGSVGITVSLCLAASSAVARSAGSVIYALQDCNFSVAPLIADDQHNLYGSTFNGGSGEAGCIFELSHSAGGWKESTIYSFDGPAGSGPRGALVLDKTGNLYGTTAGAGAFDRGAVFELTPSDDGVWAETVLYSFQGGSDGAGPVGALVFDREGNLYGATSGGGSHNAGTIFELIPGQGGWAEKLLYTFTGSVSGPDGDIPAGGVVIEDGKLLGATESGGAYGGGAIFELSRDGDGYQEKVVFSFDGGDGLQPNGDLTLGPGGAFYGATTYGGNPAYCGGAGCGVIFRMVKQVDGAWTEDVLHQMNALEGVSPVSPVSFDSHGNLYASAQSGGAYAMGTVFMLTPAPTGFWTATLLHAFDFEQPAGKDGRNPYAGTLFGDGKLFGTTCAGGIYDDGIVFEITPPKADSVGVEATSLVRVRNAE